MRIAINAISATAGGGRTYLASLVKNLPDLAPHEYLLYLPASARTDFQPPPHNLELRTRPWAERNYVNRFLWEQFSLAREAARWGADVLVCTGNFCPLRSKAPVILLSRNALYFTPRFLEDLQERRHYAWALRHRLMARLALASARKARLTITPTVAMQEMIRSASGPAVPRLQTIFHGFGPWPNSQPPAPAPPPFRFLLVSHYNYFRNFETVFRGLARLRQAGHAAQLLLSTDLQPGLCLGGYDTTSAWRLLEQLGLRDAVTTLGAVAHDRLPALYSSAHAVICPSYAESFGLTLVEAMASGVPVIASDIPTHREVAAEAALFFSPFDPGHLAEQCRALISDPALRSRLRAAGLERSHSFSWRRHFEDLLAAATPVAQ